MFRGDSGHGHVTTKTPGTWVPGGRLSGQRPGRPPSVFLVLAGALLERGAENVAERSTRVGRAILRKRLFLLGDFQRLDGDGELVRLAVELGDAGVDLLPDGEALGALLATVARQIGALDEGDEVGAGDLDVDAGVLDVGHFARDDRALLHLARSAGGHRVAGQLLDAERDALLFDVDVENLRLHRVAL